MKDWKDTTTIEVSTPDGKTTGPIPAKEFSRRVKEELKKMAAKKDDPYADKPEYWRDNALDKLGEEIRMKHHEHLHDAEIIFLMTKKASVKGGLISYGKTKLANGLTRYFARADFVIVITAMLWDKATPQAHRAMVDHELCHCSYEEDGEGNRTWTIQHHDVEEFTDTIDRHGLWHDSLKTFGQAVGRQLELGLNDKAGAKKATAGTI